MSQYEITFPIYEQFSNSENIGMSNIYLELLTYFPKEFYGLSVLQTLFDLIIVLTPPT